MFKIDNGPGGVVLVAGRLDAGQCPTAQSFLDGVKGVVTLDCRALEYISSAGLGLLLGQAPAGWFEQPSPRYLPVFRVRPDFRDRARRVTRTNFFGSPV